MLPDAANDRSRNAPGLNIALLARRREAKRELVEAAERLPLHLAERLGGREAAMRIAERAEFRMTVVGPILDAFGDEAGRLWEAVAWEQQRPFREGL